MNQEHDFIERSRLSLDARADSLEPHLAGQLRAARRHALAARRGRYCAWIPVVAVASLAAVFVGVMWFGTQADKAGPILSQVNLESRAMDFELLTSSEDLELYERLEFFYWLEQRDTNAG